MEQDVRGFLAHAASTPEHLQAVLEAAPGFALAKLAQGFFLLLLGRAELNAKARGIASEMAVLEREGGLDARERVYAAALRDWLDGPRAPRRPGWTRCTGAGRATRWR